MISNIQYYHKLSLVMDFKPVLPEESLFLHNDQQHDYFLQSHRNFFYHNLLIRLLDSSISFLFYHTYENMHIFCDIRWSIKSYNLNPASKSLSKFVFCIYLSHFHPRGGTLTPLSNCSRFSAYFEIMSCSPEINRQN